jgi:hypothetical protein
MADVDGAFCRGFWALLYLVEVTAILAVIQASGGDEKQAVRLADWAPNEFEICLSVSQLTPGLHRSLLFE